jgi:hypothetical protein
MMTSGLRRTSLNRERRGQRPHESAEECAPVHHSIT